MGKSFPRNMLAPFRNQKRLRHVLYLGCIMEEQSEEFYRHFAEHARRADVRKLCVELAGEESQHLKLIQDILAHWKPLPISQRDLDAMDADRRLQGLFRSPPDATASYDQILKYAIGEEEKMAEFYVDFEHEFAEAWKIMKLDAMVAEEKSHVVKLEAMLAEG